MDTLHYEKCKLRAKKYLITTINTFPQLSKEEIVVRVLNKLKQDLSKVKK